MLNNLQVLNGSMNPQFDSSKFEYEVVVDETTFSLALDYDVPEGYIVTIYGNENLVGTQNHVLIEVFDGVSVHEYTLKVLKETSETAFATVSDPIYEVSEYEPNQSILLISVIVFCTLAILIIYFLVFKKSKIKSN